MKEFFRKHATKLALAGWFIVMAVAGLKADIGFFNGTSGAGSGSGSSVLASTNNFTGGNNFSNGIGVGGSGSVSVIQSSGTNQINFQVNASTIFFVNQGSATLGGFLYLSTSNVAYGIGYNATFDALYLSGPTNGTILKSPDTRLTLTNTTNATTAGGGTIINMTGDKVWTLLNSTAGTGGQLIYGAINGAYGWGIHMHAPSTAQGVLNYAAGIHDPDGTGFVGVADGTNTVIFRGFIGNTTGNASDAIRINAGVAWPSDVYPGLSAVNISTFTGNFVNFLQYSTSVFKVDAQGRLAIGNNMTSTQKLNVGGNLTTSNSIVLASSGAAQTLTLTADTLAGGYVSIAAAAAIPIIMQSNSTTELTISSRSTGFGVAVTTPATQSTYPQLFGITASAVSELKVIDGGGNITLLSPHDPITNDWVFYSVNQRTGRVVRVNMEKLVADYDKRNGTHYLEISDDKTVQ